MPRRSLPVLLGLVVTPAYAQAPAELDPVLVQSRAADELRSQISVRLGASVYQIDGDTIERLPQGRDAPLSQVLLQAPGVVQDANGDIRVRGDHRNLQYRINGVIIPEAIGGFGQLFDARGVREVALITGALPAQYGYRTAGIVDIALRSGAQDPGGSIGIYGGSNGLVQPSLSYGGVAGGWEYFGTGAYTQSNRGIDSPAPGTGNLHNDTQALRGIGTIARNIDDATRISFLAGAAAQRFQIPNVRGLAQDFVAYGVTDFDSASLSARQWERTTFGAATLQRAFGPDIDTQTSLFARGTSVNYTPDAVGDLVFNGVAADVYRRSLAIGLQSDSAWRIAPSHTLRGGVFLQRDRLTNTSTSTVLPLDEQGAAFDAPFAIPQSGSSTNWLYGIYLQDEWRITDTVTMNYGARGDLMQYDVTASQISPRINLVWQPLAGTTLTAGYARYFTPPPTELTVSNDPALFQGTTAQADNLNRGKVQPERSNYFALGATQQVTSAFSIGIEGYYRESTNFQDLGQFGRAYIFTPFNYQDGRVYGGDITASYRIPDLLLYANLAMARSAARGISSNQYLFDQAELDYVASKYIRTDHDQLLTGSAGAAWSPWNGARLSATALYGSGVRRGFANTETGTPYITGNFGFAQDFRLPDNGLWTARIDVLNVTDRDYLIRDGSGIGAGAAQYLARRAVYVGLSRAL